MVIKLLIVGIEMRIHQVFQLFVNSIVKSEKMGYCPNRSSMDITLITKRPPEGAIKEKARRRAIFEALSEPTIVAAAVLNCRVRDGYGCDHRAIATGLLLPPPSRGAIAL